jgi:RNA polymerase sigma-70 factor (ECF subfamily)
MAAGYENLPEAELCQLLKKDDMNAFEEMYERYFILLLNIAFKRLQSREDALELVQDVFVQLYLRRNHLEHTYNIGGYLQTMLKNKIIDRFREQLVRKKHIYRLQQMKAESEPGVPEDVMDVKMLEQQINTVINQLPGKCREVFLLSRINNLSHQAIAEKLNISVSTVEKHIVKALKIVRKHVDLYHLNAVLIMSSLAEYNLKEAAKMISG